MTQGGIRAHQFKILYCTRAFLSAYTYISTGRKQVSNSQVHLTAELIQFEVDFLRLIPQKGGRPMRLQDR